MHDRVDDPARYQSLQRRGTVVTPTTSLPVTMNNFLATGGDGFTVNEGTSPLGGAQDIDAFTDYEHAVGYGWRVVSRYQASVR
ncbi:MAG: 5-nucleotidase [Micromonosporaceae bacterium]